ncbi:MAG: endonuclease/exonuclease/phosphatase family protein [Pirellulaceae bacterium]
MERLRPAAFRKTWRSPLGVCLALAAIALAANGHQALGQEPQRLRLLTYNIHHGEGVDGRLDLARIAGVIKAVDPDLVALQEVDRNTERTGKVDQPAELAKLTGLAVVFGPNIALPGGDYGNAVLSRLPVVAQQNHKLPSHDQGEQRGVLQVELELPGGGTVLLLATHLDHRQGDAERLASAGAINELAIKSPDRPAILAGDLNAVPESKVLQRLLTTWTNTTDKPLPTTPVASPRRQIDYVLVRPAARWKIVEARVLDEAVASDHRALLVVLELTR